jgi:Nucleotide-diphospho-sugar transferase
VFVIDLDVGFLSSPRDIITKFMASSTDIYVQKDVTFIMNRTREGWRTWYTEPLPNIGMFLCKGNRKTADMFRIAWNDYEVRLNVHPLSRRSAPLTNSFITIGKLTVIRDT